jgi:transposase
MELQVSPRKSDPTDGSEDEWAFVAPDLSLMTVKAPDPRYELREGFNAVRWRYLPGDFPPWEAVSQQTRRWLEAGVFAAMTHDLRELLRWADGRPAQPSAAIFDSATPQSTPESGQWAGDDWSKRRKGSKIQLAVDTLGHLLALVVTPANAQDRAQVAARAAAVQEATGRRVKVGFVDQGDTGEQAEADAAAHGIRLEVITLEEAKRGFVHLPRRWVVERLFA